MTQPSPDYAPDAEVTAIARDLIRIDTSNYGTSDGPGERKATEHVAALLDEVGIDVELYESEPRRTTLVARWEPEGVDRDAAPLLIHGHLDVVPANADDWSVDPFAGEVRDDCLWGRGAVDMKDFDAMVLSVVRARARAGVAPRRPIRLAFTADEEAGSGLGAQWLADHHPETVRDCTEAIGEVGGFSLTVRDDLRLYLVQTAEKGIAWLRLIADGRAGHGSFRNDDNAVTELAAAVARIGAHRWPNRITDSQRGFLDAVAEAFGIELDPEDAEETLARLGSIARMVGATMSNTVNPTMLEAGYKVNVIPGRATASIDGRFVPGGREELLATVDELIGDKVRAEVINDQPAVETEFSGALVEAMQTCLQAEDSGARAVPFLMSGGTDAKAWDRLGIRCFGFAPLRLPPDLDFAGMFHGVDERVPTASLEFGARVLDRFLTLA
ncbi:acetylornithine deacetylase/succinyl-diaminopimelate desuccinylase-like protein [Friedmanniella endophytica]|uniref:Acetylornithine deacetylase/succinyl-diaminopimelate desuccinylase-like protein n=1 Tax=Microlunatus kandeliicorticis TaxID=1759536 RepID=A0A7W3P728_9ACTN|nr:M20/M25/M40 family metallo-hydrolase [Microlunatus kandeliicorticis]MBA8795661.1 acetylornithine deacetylase/succinyl-diaminopimelate desuccinylase-like protein [Microlunatus kandeliicorticis]